MNFFLFYFSFLIIKIKNYEFNDCSIYIKSTVQKYSITLDNLIKNSSIELLENTHSITTPRPSSSPIPSPSPSAIPSLQPTLSDINNLEETKDNLEEVEYNLEEMEDNLEEEEMEDNLEKIKYNLEKIKDNFDTVNFFYIINTTFSTESGHILKIEFDFETTNPKPVWIEIKCPNFVFEFCSELDFQKININRREFTRVENCENNVIKGECKYTNDYHSSNISFIFPEIFYFFPSQIFELNMTWRDNDENEIYKNSNMLILELDEGINRTFKDSNNNIMKPNEIYLNIEKIYYQNYENKNDTFIIQTDNELNRRIYFISYCQELKQIKNFFYECVTDLNCDEIKSIQKTMNPKIDFQMKLQCEGRTQFYFYKYDNKDEGNDWWNYCSFLYNHYKIEYFFLEISDNNIISVNDIERKHWDYIMNLCQNLEIKIKSNNKYWYCEIESDCSVVKEDILKKFFQNSEAEVKCKEDTHYFYKNFSNYNPEDLEEYEYCPYIFYKFHEYDYLKFKGKKPLMNDQDENLSTILCSNDVYLRYCNNNIKNEYSSKGELIIKCNTSKDENFIIENFTVDNGFQIEIYYNDGIINLYKCPSNFDDTKENLKQCICSISENEGEDHIFVKRKNSNLNLISEIYSHSQNLTGKLIKCYEIYFSFCDGKKIENIEGNDILVCEISEEKDDINEILDSNDIDLKIEFRIKYNDNLKIIKLHNYDTYNKENGEKWEICCHIIHLIHTIDYFTIEFEGDQFKIIDVKNNNNLKQICEPYFKFCDKQLKINNNNGKDYIYCECSYNCPNFVHEIMIYQIEMEIHCENCENCENSIIYLHKYNYFQNKEKWEICSNIYYNLNQMEYFRIEKFSDDNFRMFFENKELSTLICNNYLINCDKNIAYNEKTNIINCETTLNCDDIKNNFNPELNELNYIFDCDSSRLQYFFKYPNLNELSEEQNCSYLLNKINKPNNYLRIEKTKNDYEIYNNDKNIDKSICNYTSLINCTTIKEFGKKENIIYLTCETGKENCKIIQEEIENELKSNSNIKLDLKLDCQKELYYYHYYNFSITEKTKKWEACSHILNLYYKENPEYFLIRDIDNEFDFKISIIGYEGYDNDIDNVCFPKVKNNTFYFKINKKNTLILDNKFIEPFFSGYSGFSFTVNEDGKIYYNNYEIKDENEIINSNIFDYEHLNENISNTTIPFSLYFNRIKMINDTINLLIFPVFCDSNDLYLENKICKISKNNEEIINILINNRNSNLLKYMTIEGKNSQFKIYDELNDKCYLDLKKLYNDNIFIIIKTENNIEEYYYISENYGILNQYICQNFTINNLNKNINNNSTIDLNNLIYPSILNNIPEDFFQIKIQKNENNFEGILYNKNNIILKENEIYNYLIINYGIKYKTCYYEDKFKIELYKNNELQDTSLINLNVSPMFCDNNKLFCGTNYSSEYIINLLHQNIENITCNLGKIIKEINNNYIIQIYDTKNNINNKLSKTINLGEECEESLRKKYSLSKEDKIIILLCDYKTNLFYEVYNEKGEILDISICKTMQVSNPIDKSIFSDSKISSISDLGYDVLDDKSPIYNDKCIPLSDKGNDMILEDRINDIYNSINPCLNNCEYKGFNEETEFIECECNTNLEVNNNETKKNDNLFISVFKKINIQPIFCYKLIYHLTNLKKNTGFYIYSSFIIFQIISLYALFYFEILQIQSYFFRVSNKKMNLNLNQNNEFIYVNKNKILNTFSSVSTNRAIISFNKSKKSKKQEHKKDFIIMNKFSFSVALQNDKRPFTITFLDILTDKMLFLKGIIKKSPFNLRSLNISLFILYLSIIFILNALFYTDEIISEKYHNNGLSLVTNLFRSVLSSLINMIIFSLLNQLSNYIGQLYTLLNEYTDYDIYTIITYKFFKKLRKKFIIYFVTVISLTILFLYYSSLFCIIYKGSQKSWIEGALTSILISNIVEINLCLIAAILRKYSLIKKDINLYNIYLFLHNKI